MRKRHRVCAYKPGSDSARKLARGLRIKRIRNPDNTTFAPRVGDTVVNWGRSAPFPSSWRSGLILNSPEAVGVASNKKLAFEMLGAAGVRIPRYTDDYARAKKWAKKRIVFGRRLLRSSSGRGIEIYKTPEDVRGGLPLYVRYTPKKDEYRVHVHGGAVIDVQKKMRRRGEFTGDPDTRNMVRNYDNGWVFGRCDINPPQDVIDQSVMAVAALKLDFGAVDVGWTENIQLATVYEVNTAPGLSGTTIQKYVDTFRNVRGIGNNAVRKTTMGVQGVRSKGRRANRRQSY